MGKFERGPSAKRILCLAAGLFFSNVFGPLSAQVLDDAANVKILAAQSLLKSLTFHFAHCPKMVNPEGEGGTFQSLGESEHSSRRALGALGELWELWGSSGAALGSSEINLGIHRFVYI